MDVVPHGTQYRDRSQTEAAELLASGSQRIRPPHSGGGSRAAFGTSLTTPGRGHRSDSGLFNALRVRPRLRKQRSKDAWSVAIVGGTPWGRRVLRRLAEHPRVVVRHLVDADRERRASVRRRFPDLELGSNAEAVLASDAVDVVVFASVETDQTALVRYAIESHKHVLLRHGTVSGLAETEELTALARRNGCILSIANESLFGDSVQRARDFIALGGLGRIVSVTCACYHPRAATTGEILKELVPAELALVNYLLEQPPQQVAFPLYDGKRMNGSGLGADDNQGVFHSFLRYDRQVTVNLILNRSPLKARQLAIVGEKKSIFFDELQSRTRFRIEPYTNGATPPHLRAFERAEQSRGGPRRERGRAHDRLIEHFLECIDSGQESPVNGVGQAISVARTLDSMRRSIERDGVPTKVIPEVQEDAPTAIDATGAESTVRSRPRTLPRPAVRPQRRTGVDPVYRVESYPQMAAIVEDAWRRGEGVWIASKRLTWLANRLKLRERTADGLPRVWFGPGRRGVVDGALTRALELALCVGVLTLGLPLWLLIALTIKLDRGPVFYVSRRSGRGGMPFRFIKFRSMRAGNDDRKHRQFMETIIGGDGSEYRDANGNPVSKNPNDERVTWIGRLLRKTSFDEFPQFLHVLTRQMSVVGPRPPIPYEVECYEEWMHARLAGRVGITGLWQINGRNEVNFEEQTVLDIYYNANRSFFMDLGIVLRTPAIMLSGRGAY